MLKIIYIDGGESVSDFNVYSYVDLYIDTYHDYKKADASYDLSLMISNELCLSTFCLRMLEGKIDINDIEFYYGDEKLEFDMCLGLMEPKDKVLGYYCEINEKILKLLYENIKKSRKV